ncbi:GDSL-type esterase/lipase family protein [Flavobacterium succinicans]|uniref:Acetylxylan esterase n=1 Tax=Flavobacterium succinicans TaxID=29536 RepID=A0A199XNZ4_9FLAO|nr:GDSL-type esterase/lipase family protein [Flavobacterium succinicans]OAZ03458.1 acetylxylan esterase precursor [Flavobacterium succinicans]
MSFIKKSYCLFFLMLLWFIDVGFAQTKVACMGDSVTAGYLLGNPTSEAYPSVLQSLLGKDYEVKNFGHSGATLLKKGHKPYFKTNEYKEAITYRPDIAIVHLGLNDTDPRNWPNYKQDFQSNYSELITNLKQQNPKVKVFICRMSPIFNEHPRFKSGTREWFWEIQSQIEHVAQANEVSLIDFHEKLSSRPDLFPDALHPSKEGATILATTVYSAISGNFGDLALAPVFTDNMVLQRQQPIPIYGKANAGDQVEVVFHSQKRTVVTDANGKWNVQFPAMPHGGPFEIQAKTKTKSITLKNILIGDVWLCSGQSNMAFPLKKSENGKAEVALAKVNTQLRFFHYQPIQETNESAWDSLTLAKTNQLNYFSGNWKVCDSVTAKDFSAIAYYFGKKIIQEETIPIGLIQVAVGGSPIESWIDRYTLEHDDKAVDVLYNWRKSDFLMPWVRERADINLKNSTNPKQRHPYEPCYNFEAGIKNFTSFPIKGMLWYQGESNAHNTNWYEHLFPIMVASWRKAWKANFPFYFVQLSSLDRPSWPEFRAMQSRLENKIPNSGMAISIDYGDEKDVHPIQKKEIGDRLARIALKETYKKNLVAYGPIPIKVTLKGDALWISFVSVKKLMTKGQQPLKGFEIVSKTGEHIAVDAKIIGNQVVIYPPKGTTIQSVLYAWKPFTNANLINEEGLPCSTFSLDVL